MAIHLFPVSRHWKWYWSGCSL